MSLQSNIISVLHTRPEINPKEEIRKRVDFLKTYLQKTGTRGYVLGISGGQDSTLAGKLAQLAIDELNSETEDRGHVFIALRLPYGEQFDEKDADDALRFIRPGQSLTINIRAAVDTSVEASEAAMGEQLSAFDKGNNKARERMKVQYDWAAHFHCLVLGTDHAAEAITGFYTKHGDGACDVTPLAGLNKRQGQMLLKELGSPEHLYEKVPTADLEDDKPGIPDEAALGVSYHDLDDYLEGKMVSQEVKERIESLYRKTMHKRHLPATLYDEWWRA